MTDIDVDQRPPYLAIARQQQTCPWCNLTVSAGQIIAHYENQRWMHWACAFIDRGYVVQPLDMGELPTADQDALTATTVVVEPKSTRYTTRDDTITTLKRANGKWVRVRFHQRAQAGQHYEIEEPQ